MASFRTLCLLLAGVLCLGSASTPQCVDEDCKLIQTSSLLQKVSSFGKSMVGGQDDHAAARAVPFDKLGRTGQPYVRFHSAPGISDYMFSEVNDNTCPPHSTEVTKAEECQAASEVLGTGNSNIWWSGVKNSSTAPRGCYLFTMTSNLVIYNPHPTGAGARNQYKICKAEFLFGQTETTTCPCGSEPIANATACRSAGEAMVSTNSLWGGVKNTAGEPRGCYVFFMTSSMVYYNEHPEGVGKPYKHVLCAVKPSMEAAKKELRDKEADVERAVAALGEAIDALQ